MRAELDRILARTTLWDGRASVLQVTDAVGGLGWCEFIEAWLAAR